MLTREGLPTTLHEARRAYQGLLLTDIRDQAEAKLSRPLPPEWLAEYEHERAEEFHSSLKAVPGAGEAVQRVKAAGLKVCVASQGALAKTRLTLGLSGLRELFSPGALFSAYDVPRPKPDPALFRHAAATMGVQPSACTVIEDTPVRSHGCRCRRDASDRLRGGQRRACASQRRRRDHPIAGQAPRALGLAPNVRTTTPLRLPNAHRRSRVLTLVA